MTTPAQNRLAASLRLLNFVEHDDLRAARIFGILDVPPEIAASSYFCREIPIDPHAVAAGDELLEREIVAINKLEAQTRMILRCGTHLVGTAVLERVQARIGEDWKAGLPVQLLQIWTVELRPPVPWLAAEPGAFN